MGLTRGEKKRERIYDVYSKNLALVKKHPKFSMEPDLEDAYVCPLCFRIYTRGALSKEWDDFLTLEDVPPQALGGSPKVLTCKICNNTHGSILDKHLVESLETRAFFEGKVGSKRQAKLRINETDVVRGTVSRTDEGGFHFHLDKSRSHPKAYESSFEELEKNKEPRIRVTFYGEYKRKRPDIAMLRIGYLWLFSEFGYASLINNYMHVIRKQLFNPKEEILPAIFIPEVDFPDEFVGVNIVTSPKELRAFAVVFKIRNNKTLKKHLVLLPGPSDPGLKIYDYIKSRQMEKAKRKLDLTHLNLEGVLNSQNDVYAYHEIWQNF